MVDQQRDIIEALAQRRHIQDTRLQAIIEILPQLTVLNGFLGIAIGGCYHSHVNRHLAGGSDRTNHALLNRA